jgi:hypothetical protein
MRVLRRAAVFVVLAMVVGATWGRAAQTHTDVHGRSHGRQVGRGSAVGLLDYLRGLLMGIGIKAGSQVGPLEACSTGDPFCGGEPLGGTQTQEGEEGCGIDPLGHCAPGH